MSAYARKISAEFSASAQGVQLPACLSHQITSVKTIGAYPCAVDMDERQWFLTEISLEKRIV